MRSCLRVLAAADAVVGDVRRRNRARRRAAHSGRQRGDGRSLAGLALPQCSWRSSATRNARTARSWSRPTATELPATGQRPTRGHVSMADLPRRQTSQRRFRPDQQCAVCRGRPDNLGDRVPGLRPRPLPPPESRRPEQQRHRGNGPRKRGARGGGRPDRSRRLRGRRRRAQRRQPRTSRRGEPGQTPAPLRFTTSRPTDVVDIHDPGWLDDLSS